LVEHWVPQGYRQYLVRAARRVVARLTIDYVVEAPSLRVPEAPVETIAGAFSVHGQVSRFDFIR
jgi:hypothetical protein